MVEPTWPAHQNPTNRPIRLAHNNLAGRPNMPGLPQSACRPLIRLPKSAWPPFIYLDAHDLPVPVSDRHHAHSVFWSAYSYVPGSLPTCLGVWHTWLHQSQLGKAWRPGKRVWRGRRCLLLAQLLCHETHPGGQAGPAHQGGKGQETAGRTWRPPATWPLLILLQVSRPAGLLHKKVLSYFYAKPNKYYIVE